MEHPDDQGAAPDRPRTGLRRSLAPTVGLDGLAPARRPRSWRGRWPRCRPGAGRGCPCGRRRWRPGRGWRAAVPSCGGRRRGRPPERQAPAPPRPRRRRGARSSGRDADAGEPTTPANARVEAQSQPAAADAPGSPRHLLSHSPEPSRFARRDGDRSRRFRPDPSGGGRCTGTRWRGARRGRAAHTAPRSRNGRRLPGS